jgi:hypothetical protein
MIYLFTRAHTHTHTHTRTHTHTHTHTAALHALSQLLSETDALEPVFPTRTPQLKKDKEIEKEKEKEKGPSPASNEDSRHDNAEINDVANDVFRWVGEEEDSEVLRYSVYLL